jgi:thymidylate synthase
MLSPQVFGALHHTMTAISESLLLLTSLTLLLLTFAHDTGLLAFLVPEKHLFWSFVLRWWAPLGLAAYVVMRRPAVKPGGEPAQAASPERHEEYQYLDSVRRCIEQGFFLPPADERTGVGCYVAPGHMHRWSLRGNKVPLLTTKRVPFKTVTKELLWFLSGSTNTKVLEDQGVNIWKGNSTREFLDQAALYFEAPGGIGAGYGHQWRHWGAAYEDCNANYSGKGIDQIAQLLRLMREKPGSRRLLVSAWNVSQLKDMALPPCHFAFQVILNTSTSPHELTLVLYQRSADMGLGVPFNMASYAILAHLLARLSGCVAVELVHFMAHAHVYSNHKATLQEQLDIAPQAPFPTLTIAERITGGTSLRDVGVQDFTLHNYQHAPARKMTMAV